MRGPHRFHGLECQLVSLCGSLAAVELQLLNNLFPTT